MSNIKLSDAETHINSVSTYYEAMTRAGWFLPALKSSIVTSEYLDKVRSKEFWCPTFE